MSKWRKTPPRPIRAKSSRVEHREVRFEISGTTEENQKALRQLLRAIPARRRP